MSDRTEQIPETASACDRFVCGEMDELERSAFLLRVESEPEVRDSLAGYDAVYGSLRRGFSVPPMRFDVGELVREPANPWWRIEGRFLGWIIASGFVLACTVAVAVVMSRPAGSGSGSGSGPARGDAAMVYRQWVDRGFKPSIPIRDLRQLATTVSSKLGRAIAIKDDAGVNVLGISTEVGGSPMAFGAMLLNEDRKVVVIFDLARAGAADSTTIITKREGSAYRHSVRLHGVELVEVSEMEVAVVLPLLLESGK